MPDDAPVEDAAWMRLAIGNAQRARPSPNPPVGAVLVRDRAKIADGHHAGPGGPHAEVAALQRAGESARGATMYTTLEPCNHDGRTPPCTRALIDAGIQRVVVGVRDPNPHVHGHGIEALRAAGVVVDVGVETDECDEVIRAWRKHVRSGRPYVTLKVGMSLDGRIATRTGESKWITGTAARHDAHALRASMDAIVVGAGTVRADNPMLTPRDVEIPAPGPPARVVVDTNAMLGLESQLARTARQFRTCVVHSRDADTARLDALDRAGCELIAVDGREHRVDLDAAMRELGSRGMVSVLVEGGGTLHGAFLDAGLADALVCYVAPMLIGGRDAVPAFGGVGIAALSDAHRLERVRVDQVGDDWRVRGEFSDVHRHHH